MPCIKCTNGKWKYGKKGKCQFKTLAACKAATAAIHANKTKDIQSSEYTCNCCEEQIKEKDAII